MTKRNKQGQYRKNYLPKLLLLLIIVIAGTGVYGIDKSKTIIVNQTATVVKAVAKDDIATKLEDTRKMVEAGIAAKKQVNADTLLVERAEQAYKDAVAIQNASIAEYNLTLDAMDLYGGGSLEIFLEVAKERKLIK